MLRVVCGTDFMALATLFLLKRREVLTLPRISQYTSRARNSKQLVPDSSATSASQTVE